MIRKFIPITLRNDIPRILLPVPGFVMPLEEFDVVPLLRISSCVLTIDQSCYSTVFDQNIVLCKIAVREDYAVTVANLLVQSHADWA